MTNQIKSVGFGILSDEDIEKMAVCEVDTPAMTSEPGCIYDPRMGVANQNTFCQTCTKNVWDCPGHFGLIKLRIPVIFFYKTALNMLRCFCLNCSRLICLEGSLLLNGIRGFDKVISYLSKQKMGFCDHCKTPHPEIRYSATENILTAQLKHKTTKTMKDLSVEDVKNVFDKIIDADVKLLGVDPTMFHPRNLVLTKFPVLPISCRPKMHTPDNTTSDHDLSAVTAEIIKLNNILGVEEPSSDRYQKTVTALRLRVLAYCDNTKCINFQNTNYKPNSGIKELLDKKDGIFRKNLMGKRCDETGRTVIGPDPTLKLTQVAVPRKMAEILTVPEYVTPFNKDRLTEIVNTNRATLVCKASGVKKIVSNSLYVNKVHLNHGDKVTDARTGKVTEVVNCKMELKPGDVVTRVNGEKKVVEPLEKRRIELDYGDYVERYLQDGDVGLLNRQPTLHKNSMQAMQVVIKEGKTLRLNLSQTPGFNADFDGDEMNFSVCKSEIARSELLNLSLSKNLILSSQTNKPMMAIVQDSLLGAYKMTKTPQPIDKGEFMDILFRTDFTKTYNYTERLEEIRTARKEPNQYTTPMIFSFIMPPDFFIEYEELQIERGILISGCFKKANLGGTKKSLLRVLALEYGNDIAASFIDNIQFVTNAWLEVNGFSIGLDDCFIPESKIARIEEMVAKSFMDAEQSSMTTDNPLIKESKIHMSLNKISDAGKRFAAEALDKNNNILLTVKAGSKGDYYNSTQISGVVGQQNVYGKRPSNTLDNNSRSLPHYPKNIPDRRRMYESRGFVANSFFKGLNPQESFFHAMSGREGMINTAMGTSESGYNQRKTVKIKENLTIKYDGTVRGATNNIYQFSYGYSGFDPAKVTLVNGEQRPCDVARLERRVNSNFPGEELKPLTDEQISTLCKKSIPVPAIPAVIRDAIVNRHTRQLEKLLKDVKLSEKSFSMFEEILVNAYQTAVITPGEAVGIQAAQSIGEKQTQLTLNTFHTAGKLQQTGVGRFLELLDVKKNLKVKTCTLYFKKPPISPQEIRKDLTSLLVAATFDDVTEKVIVAKTYIRVLFSLKKLFSLRLSPTRILKVLTEKTSGFLFTLKPAYIDIHLPEGTLSDTFVDETMKEFGKILLCGIEGITDIYLHYEDQEWSIITTGSSLKKLLAFDVFDHKRTYCNNMWEVLDCLGLIAMKKMLFMELEKNIVGINPEHIQLLVDKITYKGKPMPVNRYTMRTNDVGPLCKATFEESTDNIISAAVRTEVDTISGVSASIICGNKMGMGTGSFDMVIDYRHLAGLERDPASNRRIYPNTTKDNTQTNQFEFDESEYVDEEEEEEEEEEEIEEEEEEIEEEVFDDDDGSIYDGDL